VQASSTISLGIASSAAWGGVGGCSPPT